MSQQERVSVSVNVDGDHVTIKMSNGQTVYLTYRQTMDLVGALMSKATTLLRRKT